MQEPANRDATLVKHGLTGELEIAIEVICSRTASQIQPLKTTYRYMFGVNLEHDIENHASGRDTKEVLSLFFFSRELLLLLLVHREVIDNLQVLL